MTARDPRVIADQVRAAGVPDSFNRWIGMTAEQADAYEAGLRRRVLRQAERKIKNPRGSSRSSATGLGVPLGFLQRTGATPANMKGDDTMAKIKKAAARKGSTRKTSAGKQRGKSANTSTSKALKADARTRAGDRTSAKTGRQDEVAKFITGKGATAKAIGAEFGLLEHSVRALISGLKKPVADGGRGMAVKAVKNADGATVYSIAG